MSVFSLDDDVKAFLVRATASLERLDGAVAEAHVLTRNANDLITELREWLTAFQTAAAALQKLPRASHD